MLCKETMTKRQIFGIVIADAVPISVKLGALFEITRKENVMFI